MSDEKQPTTVALDEELVAQIKEKYGDKVIIQDVATKAIKFLLAASAIPSDVLGSIGDAQEQLRDLANVVAPVKNFMESIDKSMRVISPVATSAVGDSIANMQERAKEAVAKKEVAKDRSQATIGMSGKPQNAKPKPVQEATTGEAKQPAQKITNDLTAGKPIDPTAQKILEEFRKKKPTVGHPASVIGPDMGKEISIQR